LTSGKVRLAHRHLIANQIDCLDRQQLMANL